MKKMQEALGESKKTVFLQVVSLYTILSNNILSNNYQYLKISGLLIHFISVWNQNVFLEFPAPHVFLIHFVKRTVVHGDLCPRVKCSRIDVLG